MNERQEEMVREWLEGINLINGWRLTDDGMSVQFQSKSIKDSLFKMVSINLTEIDTVFYTSVVMDNKDVRDYEDCLGCYQYALDDDNLLVDCTGGKYSEEDTLELVAECYMETVILDEGNRYKFETIEDLENILYGLGLIVRMDLSKKFLKNYESLSKKDQCFVDECLQWVEDMGHICICSKCAEKYFAVSKDINVEEVHPYISERFYFDTDCCSETVCEYGDCEEESDHTLNVVEE